MGTTLQDLIDDFAILDDWEERYRYIIEMGRDLEPMKAEDKNAISRVEGCISQVWLISSVRAEQTPPLLHFVADSDAMIVKGLIAILMVAYNDRTPEEILSLRAQDFFEQLGLTNHISPNRRNGFFSMVERIQATATAHKSS